MAEWLTFVPFTLIWLALCIVLLDAYDISLPRGDSITVSGSLVAAAVLILRPVEALALGTGSLLLVYVWRDRRRGALRALPECAVRAFSVLLAAGAAQLVPHRAIAVDWPRVLLVASVLILSETLGNQFIAARRTRRPLKRLLWGNIRRQGLLLAAEVCVAALTVVLYDSMRLWALVPVMAILMLIRQAYAMLLEIRETYHQTLQVLVDAAESNEPGRVGHSERVAAIAREIGAACGLPTPEIERVSYAALLHDVHGISDAPVPDRETAGVAASVVKEVDFLSEVVPVLRVVAGEPGEPLPNERDMLAGYIVALASDIDAAMHSQVAAVHPESAISQAGPGIPLKIKARAVAAAVAHGFPVPAID